MLQKQNAIELRPSQAKAFWALRRKQCGLLNAPTGWGKTHLLKGLVSDDLIHDRRRRAVIAVPQRVIAYGFTRRQWFKLPTSECVKWASVLDLTSGSAPKQRRLREFLLGQSRERVAITTHMGLALAYGSIPVNQRQRVWEHLLAVVDEAHHIRAGKEANLLGTAVREALETGDPTTRLLLATAFFFRGDGLAILPQEQLSRFERWILPLDQHWRSFQHIRHYRYDFVAFKGSPFVEMDALLKAEQPPTLIYLPPDGHRLYLGESKRDTVERVLEIAYRRYARSWAILDLTTTRDRAQKLKWLARNSDRVGVVLAVGMMREGADWPECSRVIDLNPSGSDQDRSQRFGRMLRDVLGKHLVSYYSFFPHITLSPEKTQRDELAALYSHFHGALLLENAISPVRVTSDDGSADDDESEGAGRGRQRQAYDLLGELDRVTQERVLRESYEALISVAAERGEVQPDLALGTLVRVLGGIGIHYNDRVALARQVVLLMRRRSSPGFRANDLAGAEFARIWRTDALSGLVHYSAGFGGARTFAEVRAAMRTDQDQWELSFRNLAALAARPPSDTPEYGWMAVQRDQYRRGRLSPTQVARCESISWWSWSTRGRKTGGIKGKSLPELWDLRFSEASRLLESPPAREESTLYVWMRHQIKLYRKGVLSPERIAKCESISWWDWEYQRRRGPRPGTAPHRQGQ